MSPQPRPLALVDRDGTIIAEPDDQQVDRLEKVAFVDGAILGLVALRDAGYDLVLVSNQDGLGTASFPEEDFTGPHELMLQVLGSCGVTFREQLIDRSLPQDRAPTRKPGTAMLVDLLRDRSVDWERTLVIGDRATDLELAEALRVRGYRLGAEGDWSWPSLVHDIVDRPRRGSVRRVTTETQIEVSVDLDASAGPVGLRPGAGVAAPVVATGVGFLDHMVEQLAKHSGIRIDLQAVGDLHIDAHHTVEDTALALGEALAQALGDKRGVGRYGFTTPMDDTLAQAAVDLSGRPYLRFEGGFPAPMVGDLPTEMVPHFWRSLCDAAGLNLHLSVRGDNAHHMVEATFKAVGRALGRAVARQGSDLPTTKGVL